ncbi:MAG TPA: tetratricopeptide repeat protein [Bacteroidales bacterium]|nr:tetratricopeptide repeat protein [Bacteroidales bacterium]HRZ77315.1 tetratricopeptide repeat protein [Bacteroidales bacterium]
MDRKLYLILYALLALGLSCTPREEKAKELLEQGRLQLIAGDFNAALASLDACLSLDTTLAEAYLFRGSVRFNQRDAAGAIADLNSAIRHQPSMADAWFNRGNAWFYLNDRDKACADWKEAERLGKPNMGDKTRFCP